jgi:hypothetical protein
MTKGILVFALNNGAVDYIKLASDIAARANKYLGMPVSIITNVDVPDGHPFDQVIHLEDNSPNTKFFYDGIDKQVRVSWKNTTRCTAFDLTPYKETLVIDADYVINSSTLKYCWDQPNEFLIYKQSFDLTTWRDDSEFVNINDYSIPFYWATVFFFRKTQYTKSFFDLVEHIRNNWSYYRLLYQIRSTNFRNDYAFSIAIHMMNGFTQGKFAGHLPGKMFYTLDTDILVSRKEDSMLFMVQKSVGSADYIPARTKKVDVHVMNKFSLLRAIDNE